MKHFREYEFRCPCGCGLGFKDMDPSFIGQLEVARELAGVPFFINSSIRCPAYNRSLQHSSETSSHLLGCAVDIQCISSRDRFLMIDAFLAAGIYRIGDGLNFIHIDTDEHKPDKVFWNRNYYQ